MARQKHYRGTGVLKTASGEVVLPHAEYVITITSDERGGAQDDIGGRIVNVPRSGFDGSFVGMPMILALNDGRLWDCFLVNNEGRLTARGQGFR
jgi:hypothetical protein